MGAGGALGGGTCGAARGGQAAPATGGDLHANGALPWGLHAHRGRRALGRPPSWSCCGMSKPHRVGCYAGNQWQGVNVCALRCRPGASPSMRQLGSGPASHGHALAHKQQGGLSPAAGAPGRQGSLLQRRNARAPGPRWPVAGREARFDGICTCNAIRRQAGLVVLQGLQAILATIDRLTRQRQPARASPAAAGPGPWLQTPAGAAPVRRPCTAHAAWRPGWRRPVWRLSGPPRRHGPCSQHKGQGVGTGLAALSKMLSL